MTKQAEIEALKARVSNLERQLKDEQVLATAYLERATRAEMRYEDCTRYLRVVEKLLDAMG